MGDSSLTFFEFFAGGGMARAGLGPGWRCLFANDIDPAKARAYRENWGEDVFRLADVHTLAAADMAGHPDLVWGSFPCQDLSLAGAGRGLKGERSGAFYGFWAAIEGLMAEGRAPAIVAIENVCGALTSNGGKDFEAVCRAFDAHGYSFGALVMDASLFVPQSRPRLFVVGLRRSVSAPPMLVGPAPSARFHAGVSRAVESLPQALKARHVWWALPTPDTRRRDLADLLEPAPNAAPWHTPEQTRRLIELMAPLHRAKVEAARAMAESLGAPQVGCLYRRIRVEGGRRVQRAEVRFDGVAGCLRTPAGGSSRQTLMFVDQDQVRTRLLSPRETARLMGLSDDYALPESASGALHLTGDGVVVDAVRWLARHLFEPALHDQSSRHAA